MIEIQLRNGTRYITDDGGAVLSRTDGPAGWDYSGEWIIRGFYRRWNGGFVSLRSAVNGSDIGHGFVADVDHGYLRVWGGGGRRAARVVLLTRD